MADVYTRVTDQIVAAIEKAGAWKRPWHNKASETDGELMPYNAVSKRYYRGVNVLALWAAAKANGYPTNAWATYKQWQEKGAQVRKGEHASLAVFWKIDYVRGDDDGEGGEPTQRKRLLAKSYLVFNAAQVDGYAQPPVPVKSEPERNAAADAWFANLKADVRHGGDRAFFSPMQDFIQMPRFDAFVAPVHYYGTLAHEFTHWTGHKSRLDRPVMNRFGDEAYAFEELVAELGAAYQCAVLGLDSEPREDHAQYVASWLRTLKGDKRAIFIAAGKAQAAVDWITKQQPSAEEFDNDEQPLAEAAD